MRREPGSHELRVPGSLGRIAEAALILLAFLGALYACGSVFCTALLWRRAPSVRVALLLPAVFACFHFGFGWGYLRGLVDFFVRYDRHHHIK